MNVLLDTHILLWWLAKDRRLPVQAREIVEDPTHMVLVSAASIWEIAIKQALGRIQIDLSILEESILASGFQPLTVSSSHAIALATLPNYHRDPFDRMLIAQCKAETARLLTCDTTLSAYGKVVLLPR